MQAIATEPSLDGYDPATVRLAAAAWPLRAAEELRSARVFRALAHAAGDGPLADWAPDLRHAAADEVRHARLCCDVGARLGAPPPRHDSGIVRARLAALPTPRARLSHLLLVEAAMGETVSMTLFRAGRRAAVEPLTHDALSSILVDEVRHAELGWAALGALWPLLDDGERAALAVEAARGLGGLEQQEATPAPQPLDGGAPFDPALAGLGVLAPAARAQAFYEAVERQIVPGLTALGIDGALVWRDRYRSA